MRRERGGDRKQRDPGKGKKKDQRKS